MFCVLIEYISSEDYDDILARLTKVEFVFEGSKRSALDYQQCINITILSDDIVEYDESFYVQLTTDDEYDQVILSPNEAEVIILNNDCKLLITVYLFTIAW